MIFRILSWIKKNPVKAQIWICVVIVHLTIYWKSYQAPQKKNPFAMKKIVVNYTEKPKMVSPVQELSPKKTIHKQEQVASVPEPAKPKSQNKKAPEKAAVKETKKQPTKETKKQEPKQTPSKQKSQNNHIPENLLKELEESLNKMESKSNIKTKKKSFQLPQEIKQLEIDQKRPWEIEEEQTDYGVYLIGHLQSHLQLPEHGEVKIALTLKRDGTVIKIQVLNSESEKNKLFLEKHLPKMVFPHFPFDKQENTFYLTFCNQ